MIMVKRNSVFYCNFQVFSLFLLIVNSVVSTLQVLEEEVKKECASCKNYEAQLCKMQITSKVK